MVTVKKQIHIDAPVEKVFEFTMMPRKMLEIWPNMIKVENITRSGAEGAEFDWEYKMAGMTFHGHSATVEMEPNKHSVDKTTGGIPSTMTWDFQAENGGTHLDLEVAYEVPLPLLGRLAEKVIVKMNENEIETVLANIKAATEQA